MLEVTRATEQHPAFERSVPYRLTALLLFAWWLAYLYPYVTMTGLENKTLGEASEATAAGNAYKQALIFAFGGLGLAWMPHAVGLARSRMGQAQIALLALYCMWGGASVSWSVDSDLSIRRFISFLLIALGSVGLGAGFYAKTRGGVLTCARHVVAATLVAVAFLAVSLAATTRIGDLLDPKWTLKGSTNISAWTYPLGYSAVAALFLFTKSELRRVAAAGAMVMMMVILKGRTMIGDVMAAVLLTYSRTTEAITARSATLAAGALLTGILIDMPTGGHFFVAGFTGVLDALSEWLPYLTLGNGTRDITSLSGRIPLWRALAPFLEDRAWFGHGFGAFWTATRYEELFSEVGWRATVAHDGFLDEILATGSVGLGLFLCFWIAGMYGSLRRGVRDRNPLPPGYLVFGWMFLFLMFNCMDSILQAFFQFPMFASLTGVFALANQPDGIEASGDEWNIEPFTLREGVSR